MSEEFPSTVPEIPVTDMGTALTYYEQSLGFTVDWGRDGGGIAGISKGRSRIFLTDRKLRENFHNQGPVVIWLNLDSKEEVNKLYEKWNRSSANIQHPPESKPWSTLHEFVVADPDGNIIRVFYNF